MREWLGAHAHSAAAFGSMLVIALLLGTSMSVHGSNRPAAALPAPPIDLPPLANDTDRDTYADDQDLVQGNAHVRLAVETLDAGDVLPYLVVGTQDDHWRTGAGRELEWRHIIDADAFGRRAGSTGWYDNVLRTGAWWYSVPSDEGDKAMSPVGDIPSGGIPGIEWPQVFHLDIREDTRNVTVVLEVHDARPDPDVLLARWEIRVSVPSGAWRVGSAIAASGGAIALSQEQASATVRLDLHEGIPRADKQRIAQRWAPELRFDSEEQFFPTRGEAMQQFHGFSRTPQSSHNYRTWTLDFNNGRDSYVLLLADFNGDRLVDHADAAVMTEVLRRGGVAPPTVYVHVFDTTGDRVAVQYWFLYMYNFVEDEAGNGVPTLAHRGDREFIQLTFASRDDALFGLPESIAYSQHYRGIRIDAPRLDAAPFGANGTHPVIYAARGSHASYPAPGDDRRFRPALSGYGDRFDGQGVTWDPSDYELELLERQEWAFGHLWGPFTRYSRDLGTATKPLLQHTFRYPYIDPIPWQDRLRDVDQEDLVRLYGGG